MTQRDEENVSPGISAAVQRLLRWQATSPSKERRCHLQDRTSRKNDDSNTNNGKQRRSHLPAAVGGWKLPVLGGRSHLVEPGEGAAFQKGSLRACSLPGAYWFRKAGAALDPRQPLTAELVHVPSGGGPAQHRGWGTPLRRSVRISAARRTLLS